MFMYERKLDHTEFITLQIYTHMCAQEIITYMLDTFVQQLKLNTQKQ